MNTVVWVALITFLQTVVLEWIRQRRSAKGRAEIVAGVVRHAPPTSVSTNTALSALTQAIESGAVTVLPEVQAMQAPIQVATSITPAPVTTPEGRQAK